MARKDPSFRSAEQLVPVGIIRYTRTVSRPDDGAHTEPAGANGRNVAARRLPAEASVWKRGCIRHAVRGARASVRTCEIDAMIRLGRRLKGGSDQRGSAAASDEPHCGPERIA